MDTAIAAVWEKNIPRTRERLALLTRVAEDLADSRSIEPELRAEAVDVAHKLAGSLGMFGFAAATEHARSIELTLDHPGLPQPERLQQQVQALCEALQANLAD